MKSKFIYELNDAIKFIVEKSSSHYPKNNFEIFAENKISFEMWFTIELGLILERKNFSVEVTPPYDTSDRYQRYDLKITDNDKTYAIEIKIAHPGTYDHYKYDCLADINALTTLNDIDEKFFILIACSEDNIESEVWKKWFDFIFEKCDKSNLYSELYLTKEMNNTIAKVKSFILEVGSLPELKKN